MDCDLPETHIPSGEPTTHRDKDHHGYAMVVHRDKLYCSDQHGAPGVTSWEVRRPSLWGPLVYLLLMLWWPIEPTFRSVHVNCISLCICLAIVWTMMTQVQRFSPLWLFEPCMLWMNSNLKACDWTLLGMKTENCFLNHSKPNTWAHQRCIHTINIKGQKLTRCMPSKCKPKPFQANTQRS